MRMDVCSVQHLPGWLAKRCMQSRPVHSHDVTVAAGCHLDPQLEHS